MFGFWRGKNSSASSICRGIILHLLFIDVALLLQFIYIYKLNDIAELSNLLKMCLTYAALFLKSINFLWRFGEIAMLETSMGDLIRLSTCERQCRRGGLQAHVKRIGMIFNVLWLSSLTTILLGTVTAIYSRSERELPDKMWLPFDYKPTEARYVLVSCYQMLGAVYACTMNTIFDIYPVLYLTVLSCAADDLRLDLITCDDLVAAVDRHRRLESCSRDVGRIFSPVILAQAVCSSIILCTTAFSLSTVSTSQPPLSAFLMQIPPQMEFSANRSMFLRFLIYMLPMLLQIFLPCRFGSALTSSSEKLSGGLIHSRCWTDGDKAMHSTTMIFII